MKKKLLAMLFSGALALCVVACGEENAVSSNSDNNSVASEELDNENKTEDSANKAEDKESEKEVEKEENKESDKEAEAADDEAKAEDADNSEEEEFSLDPGVRINGTFVGINDDIVKKLNDLGSYDLYEEADSCLGAGKDKTYTYGAITICTLPDGVMDIVNRIDVEEGGVLPSGITVGTSTKDDVIEAYGNVKDGGDYLEYVSDGILVDFELEDDVVSFVELIVY